MYISIKHLESATLSCNLIKKRWAANEADDQIFPQSIHNNPIMQ